MLSLAHVIARDPDGRITFWSAKDEEIYGWSGMEAIGRVATELLQSELPERREMLDWRAQTEGRWEGEIVHVARDGRRRILSTTWVPHYDEAGVLVAFVEVNCDLTRQRAIEGELRARERDFHCFFHLNGVGNVIAEYPSGRFLRVNQTFLDITGYTADELGQLSGESLTHPEDRERDARGWAEALARGDDHYTIEKRYRRRDGQVAWVSVTSTLIRDDAGRPLYALGVILDVSARYRALADIADAQADLERRVSERTAALAEVNTELDRMTKRFEKLIDASPAAIIALDPQKRVEIWNREAETLFGLTEADALGGEFGRLPIHWDPPEAVHSLLTATNDLATNISLRANHGRTLELGVWSAPYRDGAGAGHVLILLDQTEKRFLEHALLEAGEREQRRIGLELHDGLAQQLLGAAFAAQALFKELQRDDSPAATRAEVLARLINSSVLDARNLARGVNPIESDPAGLMSALQELAERTPAAATIEWECEHPVFVRSTETALHVFRIAQEAVANAIRHSGATVIRIQLSASPGGATLRVTDNGGGLRPGAAESGVGIGIMRYRAQAIRGEFTIETPADDGTSVICHFPIPA